MTKNEYNERLVKETNDILKAAFAGGDAAMLFGAIAQQLPTRRNGVSASTATITFEEIYSTIFNTIHKALNAEFDTAKTP